MLRYLTAGESHGKALVVIIDGVPAGLKFDENFINAELVRRMSGYGRGKRMSIEHDKVEVLSGLRNGKTIASPLTLMIVNKDYKINQLPDVYCPRPGHADLAGLLKYGFDDARDVLERASARETAARVAAGAFSKLLLKEFGIKIASHVISIGNVHADLGTRTLETIIKQAELSPVRSADPKASKRMQNVIDDAARRGDTLGGTFEVVALGVPAGLGSYTQWDRKLDGNLARAVMSIQAIKAVSIGAGFESAGKKGSDCHDQIFYDKKKNIFVRDSNNAGGIEGGVTNGSPISVTGCMKPIATLMKPLVSVDIRNKKEAKASTERSDVTAVPAAGVVAESMVALEIAREFLFKFGGDSMKEIRRNYDGYMRELRRR
ncbi:MAG: chorismate synthase [Candidatus Omnitrophica bacterium]|nr:chorismate synthase [Candidatus Omnitrophota bacterium]